jgi:hypothetical protein
VVAYRVAPDLAYATVRLERVARRGPNSDDTEAVAMEAEDELDAAAIPF